MNKKRGDLVAAISTVGFSQAAIEGFFDESYDNLFVNKEASGVIELDVSPVGVFDLTIVGDTSIKFVSLPELNMQTYSWVVRVRMTSGVITWPEVEWYTEGGVSPADPAPGKLTEYIFSTDDGMNIVGRKGAST